MIDAGAGEDLMALQSWPSVSVTAGFACGLETGYELDDHRGSRD